jgi:predicted small lipoprotein YifL
MLKSKLVPTCIILLIVLALQGCGHKGPLYIAKKPTATDQTEQKK